MFKYSVITSSGENIPLTLIGSRNMWLTLFLLLMTVTFNDLVELRCIQRTCVCRSVCVWVRCVCVFLTFKQCVISVFNCNVYLSILLWVCMCVFLTETHLTTYLYMSKHAWASLHVHTHTHTCRHAHVEYIIPCYQCVLTSADGPQWHNPYWTALEGNHLTSFITEVNFMLFITENN